jgi:hypothetical protein
MKTSELNKWLIKSGFAFEEYEKSIVINGLLEIYKEKQALEIFDMSWKEGIGLELLNKAIEYTNTPISEREDEKKYCVEIILKGRVKFVNKDKQTGEFFISTIEQDSQFQTIFTQQEIENFPKEIKGAIECGFLRKVEVE